MAEDYIAQNHTWATEQIITAVRLNNNVSDIVDGLSGGSKAINIGKLLVNGTTTLDSSRNATLANVTATKLTMSGYILRDIDAGLTASTTQTQGQGALTAEFNEISTCANHKDTVTLPAAVAGQRITVVNNGAKILKIFPASSDDLGKGVDTADYIYPGESIEFLAIDGTTYIPKRFSTEETAYTPTFGGFGTVSNVAVHYIKVGELLTVQGTFTSGTLSGTGTISLPDGLKASANYGSTSNTQVGLMFVDASVGNHGVLSVAASGTTIGITYFDNNSSNNSLVPSTTTGWLTGTPDLAFQFTVRVTAA